MKLTPPHHLTGEQARLALHILDAVIDGLIELRSRMIILYEPWGEELYRDEPGFGSLDQLLGLITRPVHESAESDDR